MAGIQAQIIFAGDVDSSWGQSPVDRWKWTARHAVAGPPGPTTGLRALVSSEIDRGVCAGNEQDAIAQALAAFGGPGGFPGWPIPAPAPEQASELKEASLEEAVQACVDSFRGGSWTDFLARLKSKFGLILAKEGKQ